MIDRAPNLPPRAAAVALVALGLGLALLAPAAGASTVAVVIGSNTEVVFTATAGVANDVTVATSGSNYVLSDPAASVTAGSGCSQSGANQVTCPTSGVDRIRLNLGDGDDRTTVTASQNVYAYGGAGNDQLNGGSSGDVLAGEDGDDAMVGGYGPDWMDGGAGRDSVSYAARSNAVRADLDGAWDDGEGFELDNVATSVESVTGGAGADVFVGTAGADTFRGGAGNDLVNGLGGDDTLDGEAGNDTLDGGYGTDSVSGGDGDDALMTRDSGVLDHVNCGAGADSLVGDREDDVAAGCETADIPAAAVPAAPGLPPGPPAGASPLTPTVVSVVERRLAVTSKGLIPVTISCGPEQARDCRGAIAITAARSARKRASASRRSGPARGGRIVVARTEFRVRKGRTALVNAKASPKALKQAFGPKTKRIAATLTVSIKNSDGSTTQILKPISIGR